MLHGDIGSHRGGMSPFYFLPFSRKLRFPRSTGILCPKSLILITQAMKSEFLARLYQATIQGCAKPRMVTHDLAVTSDKFQT